MKGIITMEERVIKVLAETIDGIETYKGSNLFEDGLLDSFQVIDIVGDLEEEFDIEIDAKYVVEENFLSPDTITSLIKSIMEQ